MGADVFPSWFFDCDGVILDSNQAKTDAFGVVAARYGADRAAALIEFHLRHGGVSRFAKFEFFFDSILRRTPHPGELERLVVEFGELTSAAIASADSDPAFVPLLTELKQAPTRAYVVSGGLQQEVRAELAARNLHQELDGIFGSPRDKVEIVEELISENRTTLPGVFVGDGMRDWETAEALGLTFVFVRHWSEWRNWEEAWDPDWIVVEDLAELLGLVRDGRVVPAGASERA